MKDWQVGDKVAFVGWPDDSLSNNGLENTLVLNKVYSISEIFFIPKGRIVRSDYNYRYISVQDDLFIKIGTHVWYLARGFRKVLPKKTDISIFTAMLTDTKNKTLIEKLRTVLEYY